MNENTQAVRILVKAREDYQDMRKRMDNRIARKADGTPQDTNHMTGRIVQESDAQTFLKIADNARAQEKEIEKQLKRVLERFPIYTDWLLGVKGVGTIAAGWIVGWLDIEKATTVSKMWQYTGLNPGMIRGKKRVDHKDGSYTLEYTGHMIRGDKLTPGHVAPFNKQLRVALAGVMADGFIKSQNEYAVQYYYPYKHRLEQSEQMTKEMQKGGKVKEIMWKDAKKDHRNKAARRYMIKMFLRDLYISWREIKGLTVREPYSEEYLGKKHQA